MANAREIKRRMRSISNTQQITSAMKMVSASKLRRAQGSVGAGRPYRSKLKTVLARVASSTGGAIQDPLLEVRETKRAGFVVFASNKGLAGGYNAHVLAEALASVEAVQAQGIDVGIIAVGKKVREFFKKRGFVIDQEFMEVHDIPHSVDSNAIAKYIRSAYINEAYDEVYMVYAEFISAMSQHPITVKVLPIEPEVAPDEDEGNLDHIFEPSPVEILAAILPLYLSNQVHSALSEAKAGEHGARMTAMTAATDNAGELLAKLDLSYNRARQAAITNEITEIVGGVNALS